MLDAETQADEDVEEFIEADEDEDEEEEDLQQEQEMEYEDDEVCAAAPGCLLMLSGAAFKTHEQMSCNDAMRLLFVDDARQECEGSTVMLQMAG